MDKDLEEVKDFFKHLNLSDDFWKSPYIESEGTISKRPYFEWMLEGIRDFREGNKDE